MLMLSSSDETLRLGSQYLCFKQVNSFTPLDRSTLPVCPGQHPVVTLLHFHMYIVKNKQEIE